MRTITLRHWVLAVILLMPWVADAAGLGRLSVLSSLGQPLNAEIELVAVEKEELATLSARLASPDAYKQADLQYGPALVGLRLSIEKRPDGLPYIKAVTSRPINEPFIDLMIELNWATGRITREYTALIDPPGYAAAPAAPATFPESRPIAAPEAPVAAAPAERPAVAASAMGGDYGPIKRGDTLYKIANSIKPEGVTLEQMLVGLYRSNPDAFVKNMNRMKTGKILRVPEKEELAATPQREAAKEIRVQAADWNTYRRKLADAAATEPESRAAASGKITTRVEDKAAAGGEKDVVRLSKGEPPKGAKGGKPGDRLRTLEEEAIAREKALTEANERIAQLEKNIQDMQHLLAIKSPGMAAAQQKAEAKPGQKPETAAAKPEAPKPAQPAVAATKPEAAPSPATGAAPAKTDEPKAAAPPAKPAVAAKPKPKPKVVPPPPQPGLLDTVTDNLPLLGGGVAILLGGLGYWMVRRRRSQAEAEEESAIKSAPTLGKDVGKISGMAAAESAAIPAAPAAETAPAAAPSDEVDPLAEAEVYIAYGRDAQAEEILKDALSKNPNREDVQLKLLEIYAGRKDKAAFNGIAGGFSKLTAGQGENWLKAAAMGYVLDPGNALYAAGKDAASALPPAGEAGTGADLDFDLGLSGGGATTTDISFEPVVAQEPRTEHTVMMQPGKMQAIAGEAEKAGEAAAEALMPDFTLEIPEAGSTAATATDISLEAHSPADATNSVIDFNIELPDAGTPARDSKATPAPAESGGTGAGMDFKLDIGDINLNLDDKTASAAAPAEGGKDAHWDDVQTKFDLAKAYQEMGDKDGAKEILQEVIKEGDAKQQTEARKLLENLS